MPQIAQEIAVQWWHRSRVLLPSVSASILENRHTKVLLVAVGSLAEQQTEEEKKKIITDWYFMCTPPQICVRAHRDPQIKLGAGYRVEKHILETEGRKGGRFRSYFST